MRLTQETDYAFRIIYYLSKLGYNHKVEAKVLAEDEKIPLRFLLKIYRKLMGAGIVRSYRGKNGGYALMKKPEEITLKDVFEAIEGTLYINRCLYDKELCNLKRADYCKVNKVLNKIQNKLIFEMESVNFKDIAY